MEKAFLVSSVNCPVRCLLSLLGKNSSSGVVKNNPVVSHGPVPGVILRS